MSDIPNGYGKKVEADGTTYIGQFENGIYNG